MSILQKIEMLDVNEFCNCSYPLCAGYECNNHTAVEYHLNQIFEVYNSVMQYEIKESYKRYNNNYTEEEHNNYKFNCVLQRIYNKDSLTTHFKEFKELFGIWVYDKSHYKTMKNRLWKSFGILDSIVGGYKYKRFYSSSNLKTNFP